jgi:hypothetical protein
MARLRRAGRAVIDLTTRIKEKRRGEHPRRFDLAKKRRAGFYGLSRVPSGSVGTSDVYNTYTSEGATHSGRTTLARNAGSKRGQLF